MLLLKFRSKEIYQVYHKICWLTSVVFVSLFMFTWHVHRKNYTVRFAMYVFLSRFLWNFILGSFTKICQQIPKFITVRQQQQALCMKMYTCTFRKCFKQKLCRNFKYTFCAQYIFYIHLTVSEMRDFYALSFHNRIRRHSSNLPVLCFL
jgi:hypothetical protein